MAKFGYILNTPGLDTMINDKEWMDSFGCVETVTEEMPLNEKVRPAWDNLTARLQFGDTLVLSKLSNALHGARQLVFFLEFCRVQNIRLVSIHDRIDWANELFPDTKTSDVLTAIALLPKEANAVRRHSSHVTRVRQHIQSATQKSVSRAERNKRVVNMYLEGYSIDDIFAKSGFRSRSSIFRILNEANVSLNRGHTKGPLGPRKKKITEEE